MPEPKPPNGSHPPITFVDATVSDTDKIAKPKKQEDPPPLLRRLASRIKPWHIIFACIGLGGGGVIFMFEHFVSAGEAQQQRDDQAEVQRVHEAAESAAQKAAAERVDRLEAQASERLKKLETDDDSTKQRTTALETDMHWIERALEATGQAVGAHVEPLPQHTPTP